MTRKQEPPIIGPKGKPIKIIKQDPVARELLQKKYQEQVKPSKKAYHRKKERQEAKRRVKEE